MKKEVIIAIIGGFVLGLIITFGIATAQKSLSKHKAQQELQSPTPTPDSNLSENHSLSLFINNPAANALSRQAEINISGSTEPFSMIAAISANGRNSTVADAQGSFSLPFTLSLGVNLIEVQAYTEDGQSAQTQINAVYSPLSTVSPTPTGKQTP